MPYLSFEEDPLIDAQYDADILLCPGCGGGWTHIDHLQVEARREDKAIKDIWVDAQSAEVASMQGERTQGRSRRRHAVILLLWCESCSQVHEIVFAQHKGNTFVSTRAMGKTWEIFSDVEDPTMEDA